MTITEAPDGTITIIASREDSLYYLDAFNWAARFWQDAANDTTGKTDTESAQRIADQYESIHIFLAHRSHLTDYPVAYKATTDFLARIGVLPSAPAPDRFTAQDLPGSGTTPDFPEFD